MPIDPRQHVATGQRMRIAAEQVNALNRMMRSDSGFGGGLLPSVEPARNIVLCRNDSGSDVARWGVLEIAGIVIDPSVDSDHAASFQEQPVVSGVTPTSAGKVTVVAVEPIKEDGIGRVAVSGVVAVQKSDLEKLIGKNVLWSDESWALVSLGGSGGVRLGSISATWNKNATATVTTLKPDGSSVSPTVTFTATNYFATVTVTSGTKKVLCIFVGDRWLLVAAEC